MNSSSSVLVTGGSQGIGAEICIQLAQLGHDIHFTFCSQEKKALEVCEKVTKLGVKCFFYQCDFSHSKNIPILFDEIKKNTKKLFGLVNNAGISGPISTFMNSSTETWNQVIQINLLSLFQCTHHALELIDRGGAIVNVSSVAANTGSPGEYTWYAASKAGVNSFTKGLASELGPSGVRVNAVMPGLINTEIHKKSGDKDRLVRKSGSVPLQRVGDPKEVADCVAFLLSEKASYLTGSCIPVSGGRG